MTASPSPAEATGVNVPMQLIVALDPTAPGVLGEIAERAVVAGMSVALLPLPHQQDSSAPRLPDARIGQRVYTGELPVLLPNDALRADVLVVDGALLKSATQLPEDIAARVVVVASAPELETAHLGRAPASLVQLPPHATAEDVCQATGLRWPPRPTGPTPAKRVLFISSNGSGMGHLTRILAMARRASPGIEPHVLSLSQAVGVVGSFDLPFDYVPSHSALGIGPRAWNAFFELRLRAVLDRLEPAAVVFDGTHPYDGILRTRRPGMAYVWSRRPLWRAGEGAAQLRRSDAFDLVLEPGELAAAHDQGLTVGRGDAKQTRPIVLLDSEELLSEEVAQDELGLDGARPTALVSLGVGDLHDIQDKVGLVTAALGEDPRLQICLVSPGIGAGAEVPPHLADRVRQLSAYPISKYARAFDVAVSACGYNSFHELTAFGVPTMYVPKTATALDDQTARASWAAEAGVGVALTEFTPAAVQAAVAKVREGARTGGMRRRCREVWPGNGAGDAMSAIEALVGVAAPSPAERGKHG